MREIPPRWLPWIALILFIAGAFNDPPWRGYSPAAEIPIETEPIRVALSLLQNGAFADPFAALPTGPTAHCAPAFPLIVFVLMKLLGTGSAGWLALRSLATAALSLQFALLPYLARAFGYSSVVGILAAVLGILTKPGKEERWEANLAGLLCLLLAAAALRSWTRTTAALASLATYLQPVLLLPYFAWLLYTKRKSLLLWLAPLLVAVPWMIRNQSAIGSLAFIRDNLGIELNISFNDCTPATFDQSAAANCIQRLHPNSAASEAAEVRDLGEVRYNQTRQQQALAWIRNNPSATISLIAQRAWYFWFPSSSGLSGYATQRPRTWLLHLITLLSFLGLWWARSGAGKQPAAASLLSSFYLLFPLIYYALLSVPRYRNPILWITWLLAASALARLFSGNPHSPIPVPPRQSNHPGHIPLQ
ncbi:MAG: hypothetical protein ABI811_16500 [Acidobacteriota bacterium]